MHHKASGTFWISTDENKRWVRRVPAAATGETDLAVTGERRQSVDGFGGCFNELGAVALNFLDYGAKNRILDDLFGPAGACRFNYCRLPIGASDYAAEWYSHNENDGDYRMRRFSIARDRKYLIPYIKEALRRRRDLNLFASPWSPPTWLKHPKAYNHGTIRWDKRVLDAYALYFLKFVREYRKAGITIHQVHPQNEPAADQKFPSCVWTGAQLRDFIRDHLGPTFDKAGEKAGIWLGTLNTDDYDGYALPVLSDPGARRYVRGVGLQWAGKNMIQRVARAWPGVRLAQTENECGDGNNTWDYAHYVFNLLQHYFSNGVSAYVYWNMVLPVGGVSTWGWRQNSMISVEPRTGKAVLNPEYWVMRHFSRFIEPGAVRLGVSGPWAGNAVAFENPGGTRVVVASNPFPGPWTLVMDDGGGKRRLALPARSFNTLVIPR